MRRSGGARGQSGIAPVLWPFRRAISPVRRAAGVELSWDGGTSWTTAKTTANLTTAEATYTLGTTSDTWGRTWAVSELTNANFRIRITSRASNNSRDFSLEWAAVKVTYTPP